MPFPFIKQKWGHALASHQNDKKAIYFKDSIIYYTLSAINEINLFFFFFFFLKGLLPNAKVLTALGVGLTYQLAKISLQCLGMRMDRLKSEQDLR